MYFRFQSPRLQSPRLQLPRIQQPRLQPPRIQQPRLQPPRIQQPRLQPPKLRPPTLQPPKLQLPGTAWDTGGVRKLSTQLNSQLFPLLLYIIDNMIILVIMIILLMIIPNPGTVGLDSPARIASLLPLAESISGNLGLIKK